MTLTIELTPEEEVRLQRAAQAQGVNPSEFARRLLDTTMREREERAARLRALKGKYAHIPTSTEVYFQEKQAEIEREDARR